MTEKKPIQGSYFPFNREEKAVSPIRRASSPKRSRSPEHFVDRRQSVKLEEKAPEIIEVVKTIKYEPEPDLITQNKVQALEKTIKSQQNDIDNLYKMLGGYRQELDNMKQEMEKMRKERTRAQSPPRQKYLPRMVIVDPPKPKESPRRSLPPPVL